MRLTTPTFAALALLGTLAAQNAPAVKIPIKHVLILFQENRTPDNFFQGLCAPPFGTSSSCSATPGPGQYDIQTQNWLNKNATGGVTQPIAAPFGLTYDMDHSHTGFETLCDAGTNGVCKMDGQAAVGCDEDNGSNCPTNAQFDYVDYTTGVLNPYLAMATQYGWANYMFQTNQGPSLPAHQYIFGATSAPSASDDASGIFVSGNADAPNGANYRANSDTGCLAPLGEWDMELTPQSAPNQIKLMNDSLGTLCFSRDTMATLLDAAAVSWKFYSGAAGNQGNSNPGGSFWTVPSSIQEICQPDANYQNCTGPEWTNNVDLTNSDILKDIAACNLAGMSWVMPTGQNSDHSGTLQNVGGPSWIASIVNAIGNDATCEGGRGYWSDTAIILTWDDWGGWYDHEPPTTFPGIQGDYEKGFRVPLVVISAYTPPATIVNARFDFGSILRTIEDVFNLPGGEGALGFADARAKNDLRSFFNLSQPPRQFKTIDAPLKADFFLHDTRPPEPPDND
jgi:phospholipase C